MAQTNSTGTWAGLVLLYLNEPYSLKYVINTPSLSLLMLEQGRAMLSLLESEAKGNISNTDPVLVKILFLFMIELFILFWIC